MDKHREKLISFYYGERRMPTYSELMKLTGYRSKSAVDYFVQKLIAEGVVAKDASGKLIPKRLWSPVKVLGTVEAGFPTPAEEELADTMSLDDYLIRNPEASYILKVKGDSMIDAGIREGDMVIVERTANHKEGQIVIAEVDGEWTIKYLRKKDGKIFLEPANKKFKPIYPTEELKIAAVVRAVIRKY